MKNIIAVMAVMLLATMCYAEDVTLAWDRNKEPKVTGYNLYYETKEDAGNNTIITLDLEEGWEYTFTATAYTATDESDRSDNVTYVVPRPACSVKLCH